TSACLAGVVLPVESRAARGAASARGVRLPAAERLRARIADVGSPRAGYLRPVAPARTGASGDRLFFGCAVLDHDAETEAAARQVFATAGNAVPSDTASEPCCGAVALDLGLAEEAAALARGAATALTTTTPQPRAVALSPGCARMMREEWPLLGLPTPDVLTAPEWLDEMLATGRLRSRADAEARAVGWHDPCTLARGLRVVDAPRRVLAALGVTIVEPRETAAETRCSGGGAAYPMVDASGAAAVAAVRAADLAALGVPVATACPEAKRALRAAGLDVRDLLEVAADRCVAATD
ncbi:MAG: (Fe-S)-binding protein, partial [Frankia sp.]|nr:(Fe-S)-binding protein [Frankia sp.]